MEEKKLLIVGIDPGTTTGYAVLDIEGNPLHIKSSKQLGLNQLISETIKLGKAVFVGTDKAKAPNLVEAFATKLGAKIINPYEDLKVDEKRKITENFNFSDEHQGDALASALFAHKSARALLDKIDVFAKENKKSNIKNIIKEIVITKGVSIKSAVSIIEGKNDEDRIIEKAVFEKKLNENDFLKLYSKLKRYESELKLVRNYNDSLKNRIGKLEKNQIKNANKAPATDDKKLSFMSGRVKALGYNIQSKEEYIRQLNSLIRKFRDVISTIGNFYVMKKLDNLGANELHFKNKVLNIQKNDVLLVDDPNISSAGVIELLRNNVFVIVHKKPVSRKTEENLPFVFISAKNLRIDEDRYFGFVEKKHFEAEKSKINWVGKVIDDYKREKEQLLG